MKKLLRSAAIALCAAGMLLPLSACGNENGGNNGGGQKPPVDNKPAKKQYDLLADGHDLLSGDADDENGLTLTDAVLELRKPVVLPFGENCEWQIAFEGVLMPEKSGGGQFLNSLANDTDGRVYFGVNGANNVLFMGVCVGDTYANYCWNVPVDVMSGEHTYKIKYNGEYILTVDGGEAQSFESVNVNQSNRTAADGAKASEELTRKICAVTGQKFLTMNSVGSFTHPCTNFFKSFKVETTALKGYTQIYEHPLAATSVYYIGSSVTRGHGGNTDGNSFADMTAKLTGGECKKETISGTNLAITDGRSDSYVERLARLNLSNQPNVLVVQLSTNDFSNNVPLGTVSEQTASSEFDKRTITGALEYILATVKEISPDTITVIYTCPLGKGWGKYAEYGRYVNGTLKELETKWADSLAVLDLYNAEYVKVPCYMQGDELHPQKEGYAQVFTPFFIELLNSYFA